MLKSVAQIVSETPEYADLTSRFEMVDHTWFQNGEVMDFLMTRLQPRTICEIGSWMGGSARFMARYPFVEKVICVDHWDRTRVENWQPGAHPERWMDHMYEYFLSNTLHTNFQHKIYPVRMDSVQGARYLREHCYAFDMIYIDGAHATEWVRQDLRNYLPLLRRGGLYCGDDWLHAAEPEDVRGAVLEHAREIGAGVLYLGNFWWYHF